MWRELFEIARDQHHVVHVRQAERCGIASRTFYDRATSEEWPELQRGVRLLPGVRETWASQAAAVILAAGDRAALTGESALHVHGIVPEPRGLQIALPADRARPRLLGVTDVVRTTCLLRRDVVELDGHRTLVVPWALLHSGRVERPEKVLEWKITADQRGKLQRGEVEDVLNRSGTATGKRSLRLAYAATVTDIVDSVLELDARNVVRSLGYAPYPSPFPFLCPDRRVVHLDLPLPTYWFAYECDSPQSRAGGRAFRNDRTRWTQAQKGGWRIGWLTRDRITSDRDGIAEELRDVVANADLERPPPPLTPCRQRRCRICPELRRT